VTVFLKFAHLAAIAIWSGGLLVLPFLFWQRGTVADGPDLDRLHRITRFVYVGMTSPAAVIAIGSGTALIFLRSSKASGYLLPNTAKALQNYAVILTKRGREPNDARPIIASVMSEAGFDPAELWPQVFGEDG